MVRLSIIIFLLAYSAISAQPAERLEALKTSFITTQIDLTPDEAQRFWPIYNAHQQMVEKVRRDEVKLLARIRKNLDSSTEEEASNMLHQFLEIERERNSLRTSKVYLDVSKIIGAKRTLALKKAEFEFKQRMLKELSERRAKRGNRRRRR